MTSIRVDIDENVHRKFKAHFAIAGESMSDALRNFITAIATNDEEAIANTRQMLDTVDENLSNNVRFGAIFDKKQ